MGAVRAGLDGLRGSISSTTMLTIVAIAACSPSAHRSLKEPTASQDVTAESALCLSKAEKDRIERGPRSDKDIWKLVNHLSLCENEPAQAEPWLRMLAAYGDKRATAELSSYLEAEKESRRAAIDASRAKELGSRAGSQN